MKAIHLGGPERNRALLESGSEYTRRSAMLLAAQLVGPRDAEPWHLWETRAVSCAVAASPHSSWPFRRRSELDLDEAVEAARAEYILRSSW